MVTADPSGWVGRVAIVTGGTSGLGREIALGLARRGATTVIVGRGSERVADVAEQISRESGAEHVEGVPVVDLAVRAQQRAVGDELLRRYPRIHLLVNNAGGLFARRQTTADGLERTFALNVLAPFTLTQRLAPRMRESGPSRVVNISSAAHRGARLDFSDLQGERHHSGWSAYGRSKLALLLLTREFARRFGPAGPTVNAVHPGFVRTRFAQNNGGLMAAGVRFAAWIGGRSVSAGADTPLYVATDPSLAAVSGEYFADRKLARASSASYDSEAARRLFEVCAELAGGDAAAGAALTPP